MITASVWVDTETTGIDPRIYGAFEIAVLVYIGANPVFEKLYRLNPLNEEIRWSESAFKVNGVAEQTILSYPPPGEVVRQMAEDLRQNMPAEKYVFAGYNCKFDYGHIEALFSRNGVLMGDFFNGSLIDVLELVRKASDRGLLPATKDRKLETMAKALGIPHENAHTALDDIKATRKLYETIYFLSRNGGRK